LNNERKLINAQVSIEDSDGREQRLGFSNRDTSLNSSISNFIIFFSFGFSITLVNLFLNGKVVSVKT
jgi:hypothetical protein